MKIIKDFFLEGKKNSSFRNSFMNLILQKFIIIGHNFYRSTKLVLSILLYMPNFKLDNFCIFIED